MRHRRFTLSTASTSGSDFTSQRQKILHINSIATMSLNSFIPDPLLIEQLSTLYALDEQG